MIDIIVSYKAAHSNYPKAISLSLQAYYSVRYVPKSKKFIGFKPLPCFSVFFPPCCCSICYLQDTKPWALQPSPPSNWMMPSVSCGGHTSPPLLTRCPSSRTGTGTRDVAKGDLPICMPLWKYPKKVHMIFLTSGLYSLGSTLPSAVLQPGMTSERWLPRLRWAGRLWA